MTHKQKKPPAIKGADGLQNNFEQNHFTPITELCNARLFLVSIPPIAGKPTKAPCANGWNKPRSAENLNGYSNNPDDFLACGKGFNFGLHHGASGTLALDLDDMELARKVFDELTDLKLPDWLNDSKRAEIRSPKPNRGKLLFKLPDGFTSPGVKQCKKDKEVIFELRTGNGAQDVIIGEHPDFPGQRYQFIGDPAAIPEAPEVLIDMLQNWNEWKPCFDSVLGIDEQEPPKIAPQRPQQGENLPGQRNPIQEFNRAYSVADVLIQNGYRQAGKDRFIRPGSESKAPGAVIMRNCADGIERIYSHGGDSLNDGFAHDAFDCFRLLEHGGDFNEALNWSPEITKHNQRLYMQEQAQNGSESPPRDDYIKEQADPKEKPLFPLVKASELTSKPVKIDWLLENIIEQGSLNLLFGEPGACKSLFALDWAFCMASGMDWNGYRTQKTDVVIIAGEGHSGMGRRLKALESKYNTPAPEQLYISKIPAQLLDEKNAQLVAGTIKETCPNPGLVIIDTLHRNMAGDENSSQDIAKLISNLDMSLKPLGCAVLIVHHSGHGPKDRSRGSSSIRAAMDGEFSATKDGDAIVLSCHKAKDFEALKPMRFSLKPVELDWCDDDGEQLSSVYLDHDGEAKLSEKKRKLTARDDAILTSLREAIADHGVEPSTEIKAKYGGFDGWLNANKKVVHIDHWREKAYPRLDTETPDAKQKAFKRCRDKLFELGKIVDFDGYWWPIYD